MNYLLDTNTIVNYFRLGNSSPVTQRLLMIPTKNIYICSVVIGELLYGVEYGGPKHANLNMALVAKLRVGFQSLPFDDRAAESYASIRSELTKRGQLIGANDMLIAAIAVANTLTLVTNNFHEFSRVPGLVCEDWQSP